jgi:hypothetical protein
VVAPGEASGLAGLYQALLGLIPDNEATRQYAGITNYALLHALYGIEPPAEPADEEAWQAYIGQDAWDEVSDNTPVAWLVSRPTFLSRVDRQDTFFLGTYLGYRGVELEVSAGAPPEVYEALYGEFEPDAALAAIDDCAVCAGPAMAQHAGVTYYSWGDDFQQDLRVRLHPPVFDQLGRGGHYVLDPEHVFRALWEEGLIAMIDAWRDEAVSLADDADFRTAAEHIEALGAFSATFSTLDGIAVDLGFLESLSSNTYGVDLGSLMPPAVNASANGLDAGGAPYLALVRVYASDAGLQDQEAVLTRLFSETAFNEDMRRGRVSVESEVNGAVLTLILRPKE